MNYLLEVCLLALTLTTGVVPAVAAQSPEVMLEPNGTLRLLRRRQRPEQVWENEVDWSSTYEPST